MDLIKLYIFLAHIIDTYTMGDCSHIKEAIIVKQIVNYLVIAMGDIIYSICEYFYVKRCFNSFKYRRRAQFDTVGHVNFLACTMSYKKGGIGSMVRLFLCVLGPRVQILRTTSLQSKSKAAYIRPIPDPAI